MTTVTRVTSPFSVNGEANVGAWGTHSIPQLKFPNNNIRWLVRMLNPVDPTGESGAGYVLSCEWTLHKSTDNGATFGPAIFQGPGASKEKPLLMPDPDGINCYAIYHPNWQRNNNWNPEPLRLNNAAPYVYSSRTNSVIRCAPSDPALDPWWYTEVSNGHNNVCFPYASASVMGDGKIIIGRWAYGPTIGSDVSNKPGYWEWCILDPTTNTVSTKYQSQWPKGRHAYNWIFPHGSGMVVFGESDIRWYELEPSLADEQAPANYSFTNMWAFTQLGYMKFASLTDQNPVFTQFATVLPRVIEGPSPGHTFLEFSDVFKDPDTGLYHVCGAWATNDGGNKSACWVVNVDTGAVTFIDLTAKGLDSGVHPRSRHKRKDSTGRFYYFTIEFGHYLQVCPCVDGDTNGSQLGTPETIDLNNNRQISDRVWVIDSRTGNSVKTDNVSAAYVSADNSAINLVEFQLASTGGGGGDPTPTGEVITKQVESGDDDGYYQSNGGFQNTITRVYLGAGAGNPGVGAWTRFTSLSALQNATILHAYPYFTGYAGQGEQGGQCVMRVKAVKTASPTAPSSYADIAGYTLTDAYVDWTMNLGVPDGGIRQRGPDIAAVIQEVIDAVNPTAIQLIFEPVSGVYAAAYSYEADPTKAGELEIEYTGGSIVTGDDIVSLGQSSVVNITTFITQTVTEEIDPEPITSSMPAASLLITTFKTSTITTGPSNSASGRHTSTGRVQVSGRVPAVGRVRR